jgi:hypothetical protein
LSGLGESLIVNRRRRLDSEALILEVTRYLAAVDAFRIEKCEPTWLPELVSIRAAERQASSLEASSLASGKHLH